MKRAYPIRVLVTGFGPFPGVPHNASETLVRLLATQASFRANGIEVSTAVLPVTWESAHKAASSAVAAFAPDAVLHFGVSRRATAFEIESRAVNMCGQRPDAHGRIAPPMPLVRAGKPLLAPTLAPLHLIRALRRANVPAELSRNAGRYLCNALYYRSLAREGDGGPLAAFIHMPVLGDPSLRSRITMTQAVDAARILVQAAAEAVLSAKRQTARQGRRRYRDGSQTFHRLGRSGGPVRRERG
jgi:pyroglutamyl-peptidase